MGEPWLYQVRAELDAATADKVRSDPGATDLAPLARILERHKAKLVCQYDAFAGYVAEAEREGVENYPLHAWTKATIEDPAKKEKYLKHFTFYVEGEEVYPQGAAAALAADLEPLVRDGLIGRVRLIDTNPANNPQPPARPAG